MLQELLASKQLVAHPAALCCIVPSSLGMQPPVCWAAVVQRAASGAGQGSGDRLAADLAAQSVAVATVLHAGQR